MELSILTPKCVEKVYSRPFMQMSWPNKDDLVFFNDKYHAAAWNVMASLAMFQNECR